MSCLSLRCSSPSISSLGRMIAAFPFIALFACGGGGPSGPDDRDDHESPVQENPGEDVLSIFYTTDERGRIEPGPGTDGAANLMGVWRAEEGLTEDEDFLVVSGGNSWTGTLISTWFDGASVVAIMNAMGYDGMAIGNLDFQFGQEELARRAVEAEYPLLSANTRLQSSGATPGFATAYSVETVNDLKVGLIGLTPLFTPESNTPASVEGLDFRAYADALSTSVPQVRSAGADLVVVLAHLCYDDITPFLPVARQLGVSMIGGAYCGETKAEVLDGVAVVFPDWGFSGYGKVTIRVKESSGEILGIQAEVKPNSGGSPDEEVEVRVQHWQSQMEAQLSSVVGYLDTGLDQHALSLHNLVMDSWINTYPADIAILNAGAIRTGLPAGDITKGNIVGMLPFENKLVELKLTGAEVIQCIQGDMIFAGMSTIGGYFHSDGTEMKMDSVYTVLTTDFLYGQSATAFSGFDDTPKSTEILYSGPTLTYLEVLQTSPENPLDQFLDSDPRK